MIIPLRDNILLEKVEDKEQLDGIILVEQQKKDKIIVKSKGVSVSDAIKEGCEVVTNGRGTLYNFKGTDYLVVKEEDILAIVK